MKGPIRIGQLVRVVGDETPYHGLVGVVEEVGWNDDFPVRVKFTPRLDNVVPYCRFREEELEIWNGLARARSAINGR